MQAFSVPFGMTVTENEPLFRHSSMRTGGTAGYAAFPFSAEELSQLILEAERQGIRTVVIGNGTNVLFDDNGFDGLVIFTANLKKILWNGTFVTAEAGASLSLLAKEAALRGLSGLEALCGIPATLGGAVCMNAGAGGQSISDVFTECVCLSNGVVTTKTKAESGFGYRKSIYQTDGMTVLSATLTLAPDDPAAIKARMDAHMQKRRATQPLDFPSAGSVFKRPEKDFAGALIEKAGLKGFSVGGAAVSEKHAGFIINRGNATTADVLALMNIIREKVASAFGTELEPEVIYIR